MAATESTGRELTRCDMSPIYCPVMCNTMSNSVNEGERKKIEKQRRGRRPNPNVHLHRLTDFEVHLHKSARA